MLILEQSAMLDVDLSLFPAENSARTPTVKMSAYQFILVNSFNF